MLGANKTIKKKRVSKKTKTAWRKHVDISDVDNFLEEQRLEERIGKLDVIPDKDLFVVDTTPSTDRKLTSKQLKRKQLREAPLKCHSLLKPLTNVPDPISKRNRVKTKEERKCPIRKKVEAENLAKGILKRKEIHAIENRKKEQEKRCKKPEKFDFNTDIWETDYRLLQDIPDLDKAVVKDEWINGDVERHLVHGRGKTAKRVPRTVGKSRTALEAVELPHPGMSYNPSFKDHQDLLRMVAEKEEKVIKEEKHLNRVTKGMFRKVTAEERDISRFEEMSEGLPKPNETINEDNSGSDNEYKSINPPVKNKLKSTKQRRKQKEQLMLEETRRKAKIEKKKVSDLYKLKFIEKQLEKAKSKTKMLHDKRLKKIEYKKREAGRLGSVKFEDAEIDFSMGNELTGNLRTFRVEGNLLNDRFKSLQKRNVIEPRTRQSRKKPKIKKYTRPGHKDDWKTTVASATLK